MTLAATFQVRVRRQTAADLWVQVTSRTTILEVKRKIFEDGAIPPNSQRCSWLIVSEESTEDNVWSRN